MTELNEVVTPLKSSSECVDCSLFKFENGDCYLGYFKATKKELHREGLGKYFCSDGESYYGLWRKDELLSANNIVFKGKRTYKGQLNNMQMVGEGIYKIPDIGDFHINFKENKPCEDINLIDINGYCWKGICEDDGVILHPVNQFKIYRNGITDMRENEVNREIVKEPDELSETVRKTVESHSSK